MKEYKVLAAGPSTPFVPVKFELDLNRLGTQGWKVVACTSGAFYTGMPRHEIVVILERDIERR